MEDRGRRAEEVTFNWSLKKIGERWKIRPILEEVETGKDEFVVESGLIIYDEPDFSANPKYVILPGAKVKVVKRKGD